MLTRTTTWEAPEAAPWRGADAGVGAGAVAGVAVAAWPARPPPVAAGGVAAASAGAAVAGASCQRGNRASYNTKVTLYSTHNFLR